jgi:CDP-glycerol glycerophosphotransferase (TagB/SpsB family)
LSCTPAILRFNQPYVKFNIVTEIFLPIFESVNIVVADISFEANKDIYIQSDILIGDDSNVIFEAGENVVIYSNFKVNSGSTLSIIID